MATREIARGSSVFEVPCKYLISSYDEFEDKEIWYSIIKEAQRLNPGLLGEESFMSKTLIAVMLMIQDKYHSEDPFQRGSKYGEETRTFMRMQLELMKATPFDTMSQWNKEEIEFYSKVSFGMNKEEKREIMF